MKKLLNSITIILLFSLSSFAQLSFSLTTSVVGSGSVNIAIGDINGDGISDMAIANWQSNTFSILTGTGSGGFGNKIDYATNSNPRSIALGDFNGDSKIDLAVTNEYSNNLSIFLNQGYGILGSKTDYITGSNPESIASGDFNSDGFLDLAVANWQSNSISIFTNTGISGIFGTRKDYQATTNAFPFFIAVGDVNNDNKLDFVIANQNISSIGVFTNTGNGSFSTHLDYLTGAEPTSIAIGDINGDGKADVVTANHSGNSLSVLTNTGNGAFGTHIDYTTGSVPYVVSIGDLNGDGKPDLAVANANANSVSVLTNTGNGSFSTKSDYPISGSPWFIRTGDLNNDGKQDLVTANYPSNSICILLNTSTFTGSSQQNSSAHPLYYSRNDIQLLGGSHSQSIASADLNGDGYKDYVVVAPNTNLAIVLTNTGTGSFTQIGQYATGSYPYHVAIGDFNNDNKPDFATTNYFSNTISVFTNTGFANFSNKIDYTTCIAPHSVAFGDLNGDGNVDLAIANSTFPGTISILTNTGNGSFATKRDYSTGSTPNSLVIADLNNDGKLDIATADGGDWTVSVLTNSGIGNFLNKSTYNVGQCPFYIAANDLNGDGKTDLVISNVCSNSVSVLTNTGNGSFGAKLDYNTCLAPYFVTLGNLNGDNKIDIVVGNQNSNSISVFTNSGVGLFTNRQDFSIGQAPYSIAVDDFNGDNKLDLATANPFAGTITVLLFTNTNIYNSFGWTLGLGYPTPNQDVLVNSNYTLSSVLGVSNATISSGITLTVPTGYVFTLSGMLTNNGTIVVEDGASLVQASGSSLAGSGTYIIKRNGTYNSTQYNYYSSPVSNGTTAMLGGNSAYVYQYTETSPRNVSDYGTGWQSASGNLTVGKGYTSLGSGNINFTGTVNNGNISTPVTYTNIANNITADGWNLVGNPYPSSIDISSFLSANSSVLYTSGVYFWNGSNYVTFNSGSVPSCQGFFVSAKTNGNVNFTNSMRTRTNTSLYRVVAKTILKLSLTNPNGQKDITQIEFTSNGSDGFNPNEDALKLKGNTVLQLYSKARNSVYDLAINVKSNLYLDTTVQLVYDGAVSGLYQLSLDEATNVPDKIWLEDKTTNTVSELKKGIAYTFTGGNTSANQRLVLKLSGARTEILTSNDLPNIETKEISIKQKGKDFEIEGKGNIQAMLIDLQGRILIQAKGENTLQLVAESLNTGVYILKVSDKNQTKAIRVLIF